MNSIQKLDKLTEKLKKIYKTVKVEINDDTYFILENGVVFQLLYFDAFNCFAVSYANDINDANRDFFEEGDQFDADQSIEAIFAEIQEEIRAEAA